MENRTDGLYSVVDQAEIDRNRELARIFWTARCRLGASVPAYLIADLRLDELFEFAPDPDRRNGEFYIPRERPHGPPQANP